MEGLALAIVVVVVTLLLLLLLLRLGRGFVLALLAVGGLTVAGVFALAMFNQAAASREAAEAATQAATATKAAAVGQSLQLLMVTLLAVILFVVVLLAGVAVGYFWLRAKRAEAEARKPTLGQGQWLPGPNARWQRQPVRGGEEAALLPLLSQIAAAQTMMMAWMQGQETATLSPTRSLSAESEGGDDWWWPESEEEW